MSNRKVKTRQTCEQAFHGQKDTLSFGSFTVGWNAALASVILPVGRFEVGDVARANYRAGLKPGLIAFVPDDHTLDIIFDPLVVHKVVELTVNEKIHEVATAMLRKIKASTSDVMVNEMISAYIEISQHLANGKTIDQLCAEHGVSTTKGAG